MPKIREYKQQESARVGTPGRTIRASDIGGGADIQQFGAEVGGALKRVEDHKERLEVTEAHRLLAETQANWTLHLQERELAAESGDETFAETFNADFKTYIDEGRNKFQTIGGQQTYEQGASALTGHFVAQSGAATARLVGARARSNFESTVDSFQRTLANDPTQFQNIQVQLNGIINNPDGMFFKIDPELRPALEREALGKLAKTTMESIVQTSPKLGKQFLENPESNASQYLLNNDLLELKKLAEIGIKENERAAEHDQIMAKSAKEDEMDATKTGLIQRVFDPNHPEGMPSVTDITQSGMDGDRISNVFAVKDRHIRNMAEHLDISNPVERKRLHLKILNNEIFNTDEIDASYAAGKLSKDDHGFLYSRLSDSKDPTMKSFSQDAQSLLNFSERAVLANPVMAMQTEKSTEAIGRLTSDFYEEVKRLRDDNKNPRVLLNPDSPEYFFSAANIKTYTMPGVNVLQEEAENVLESELKKLPTDSADLKSGDMFLGADGEIRIKRFKKLKVDETKKGLMALTGELDSDVISMSEFMTRLSIPHVETEEDFNALKSGAEFVDPKGNVRKKP